ncbi:nucleotide exchange factor GrpE [Candidatus Sumerlaeota bacterium]|nr:nucleotide exchange factor GrpE [Candidatus Sumerlaeota bacterium]
MSDQIERTSPEDPEALAAELRQRWIKTSADLDNLRKRLAREVDAARRDERSAILTELLGVIDNLERAIASTEGVGEEWIEGMRGIQAQMLDVCRRFGVEPFDALQEMFDPDRHDAVSTVDDPGLPEGAISAVLLRGYQWSDGSVLRHAHVIVVQRS